MKRLTNRLKWFRKEVTQITARYIGSPDLPAHYFVDPNIASFSSYEEFNRKMENAFLYSNVAQDDKESIRKIFMALTKMISQEPSNLNSPIDYFNYLLSIERGVLAARADAASLIRMRVGGCDCYGIDKFITLVDFPSVGLEGDTVDVSAFFAGYDSDKVITGTINGKPFETSEGGMVKHKIIIPKNKSELKLKGTLTIVNKSSVPNTEEWKKTIQILQPNK